VDHIYPAARNAWGNDRTLLVLGGGGSVINNLRDEFNINNETHLGNGNAMLASQDYPGWSTHPNGTTPINYSSRSDCDLYASWLSEAVSRGKFKGGGVFEFSVGNWVPMPQRAQDIGRLHTALHAKGLFFGQYDLEVNSPWSFSYLYNNVPGSEGTVVQAVDEPMRAYCGRSGRTQ
jgi:hypothetical protein